MVILRGTDAGIGRTPVSNVNVMITRTTAWASGVLSLGHRATKKFTLWVKVDYPEVSSRHNSGRHDDFLTYTMRGATKDQGSGKMATAVRNGRGFCAGTKDAGCNARCPSASGKTESGSNY